MHLLTPFILRVSFGLALGMALTSPRQVPSGYFRNHLYVLLGLNVLAALVAFSTPIQLATPYSAQINLLLWPPALAAALSYVGSVCWLYEKPRPGIAALLLVAGVSLAGAILAGMRSGDSELSPMAHALHWLDPATGGLVLGFTLAAMFLGHWYLNTPTMVIAPLQKLVVLLAVAVAARIVVCGIGLGCELTVVGTLSTERWLFLLLRWLSGLVGTLLLCWMTYRTLQIPNTQAATGMLYVAVIATFLGELTSMLLSAGSMYPL